jgi:predicted RNase H-like nuclease (RuvC/YqgF family)
MSDDLVKQLRESAVGWDGLGFHVDAKRDRDAADRIEQLEKQLVEANRQIKELENELDNIEYEMCDLESGND